METLATLWPIIVTAAGVMAAGGAGRYALRVLTQRLDLLTATVQEMNTTLATISTKLAVQAARQEAHEREDTLRFGFIETELHDLRRSA